MTTVVATPGQGPDRPQEVSYTDIKVSMDLLSVAAQCSRCLLQITLLVHSHGIRRRSGLKYFIFDRPLPRQSLRDETQFQSVMQRLEKTGFYRHRWIGRMMTPNHTLESIFLGFVCFGTWVLFRSRTACRLSCFPDSCECSVDVVQGLFRPFLHPQKTCDIYLCFVHKAQMMPGACGAS